MTRIITLFIVLFCFTHQCFAQVASISSDSTSLPKPVLKLLDEDFETWRLCTPRLLVKESDSESMVFKPFPSFEKGDFNNDDQIDYALQIFDSKQQHKIVTAYISNQSSHTGFVVKRDSTRPNCNTTILGADKAGTKYYDFRKAEYSKYERDVVTVSFRESAQISYIFNNGSFERVITGD